MHMQAQMKFIFSTLIIVLAASFQVALGTPVPDHDAAGVYPATFMCLVVIAKRILNVRFSRECSTFQAKYLIRFRPRV